MYLYPNRWISVNYYKGFRWAVFNCIKHLDLAKFVIFADFNRKLTLDEMSYSLPEVQLSVSIDLLHIYFEYPNELGQMIFWLS